MQKITLGDLAKQLGATLQGDASLEIHRLSTLDAADAQSITFLANSRYAKNLSSTKAGAVILEEKHVEHCASNALISSNPYLDYARVAELFDTRPKRPAFVSPSAQIMPTAIIASDVHVGANVVINDGAEIGSGTVIEANCVIGENAKIGKNSRLFPNVTVYHGVQIGSQVTIHSGVVIGADGFGFAPTDQGWQRIAQIGGVIVGDNVNIGANTTIDRGAINNTVIGNGVILDNQIQIAHNVIVGDYTAIAACAGIAGSTEVGSQCLIGGGARIAGHITICDNAQISATTMVINSITEPNIYSSGVTADKHRNWLKNASRFKKLAELFKRVDSLEKKQEK